MSVLSQFPSMLASMLHAQCISLKVLESCPFVIAHIILSCSTSCLCFSLLPNLLEIVRMVDNNLLLKNKNKKTFLTLGNYFTHYTYM